MTIEQKETVDAIGVNEEGKVVLTISDHLEWGKESHLHALQEKLNTYLRFIESGEIFQAYENSVGRQIVINVVCKHDPTDVDVDFLKKASEIVSKAGFGFSWESFGEAK